MHTAAGVAELCSVRVVDGATRPHGHTILWPLPYLASCLALGLALTNLSTEGALSACVTLSESPAWPTPSHQQLDSSPLDCLSLSLGPKFPSNENSIRLKASPRTSHPTGRPEEREEKRPQFLEVRHASHPSQVRSSPRQRASGMGGEGVALFCSVLGLASPEGSLVLSVNKSLMLNGTPWAGGGPDQCSPYLPAARSAGHQVTQA